MRKTQMVSAVCLGLGMSMACPRRHRMPKPMATAVRLPTATAPQRLPLRRPTTRPIVSYLHNFPRDNVSLTLVGGAKQPLGDVQVGDVYDASIGMGLALNDRASISMGYDQSFIGVTKQNGQTVAGSSRSVLGSLLLGGSYRLDDTRTLNFALGVGVTRDTPDVTVTVRVPITL